MAVSVAQIAFVITALFSALVVVLARTQFMCGVIVGYAHSKLAVGMQSESAATDVLAALIVNPTMIEMPSGAPLGMRVGLFAARVAIRRMAHVAGADAILGVLRQLETGHLVIHIHDGAVPRAENPPGTPPTSPEA